ncbi:hypothetical protein [Pseudomonas mohnii]
MTEIKISKAARGAERTSHIETRVKEIISVISTEIATNGGVYPANGGAVNKTEVIRRAAIGKTTLFSKTQACLNQYVDIWLASLKVDHLVTRGSVRASHEERAAAWKQKYEALSAAHHLSELELQQFKSELFEANRVLEDLLKQHDKAIRELESVRGGNVVSIRKR